MRGSHDDKSAANQRIPAVTSPILSEAERHQLLVEWNRTCRDYPRDKCIHELFEEQVNRAPDAVAVVFEENSLSYRELNAQADRVAWHLRSLGVGPQDLVGLQMERSLEMIIGVLGILKAGGAYWALEENLPEERLQLLLADARPRVLLVRRKSAESLPVLPGKKEIPSPDNVPVVAMIEDLLESSPGKEALTPVLVQASDAAYVSYTSGSTGRPKGVVVPHRGVVRLVKGVDYASLNADETFLQLSPLSFDASTFELWGALLNGGRLVLLPPGQPTLTEIGEAIYRHGVTTLWLTAGLFHLMVEMRLDDLKPLRQLLAGGDVLSSEHVRKARSALPGCRIINGYGPTENTTFTCCHTVTDEEELTPTVPIGRPVANTQVYILDETGQPVPVGVAGELYAGGDGVASGYLHQPELTAEKFVPDPFNAQPGGRLYRTGDLARWRPDGTIEYVGRLDHQIKIRGFRVELEEIEAVLRGHPHLISCAVVAQDIGGGDKALVAFVIRGEQGKLSVRSLREWLEQKLPGYMVPSRFVEMPALPLNLNGKVDRKVLVNFDGEALASDEDYVAPRTERERVLAEIWQAVLQRERVSVRDNFFELGGHSLLAVTMCLRITSRLGVEVPLRWVFEYPVIEDQAKQLESMDAPIQSVLTIEKIDRLEPLPMSFGQQQFWLIQETLQDHATYNESRACRLSGPVNREKIRRALAMIMERHEVLRTALVHREKSLVQEIACAKDVSLPWREVELSTVPADRKEEALKELLLEEARGLFDLAQAPLWRAVWIKLNAEEHVLTLTFHHSIVDEWSQRLFLRELEEIYASDGRAELAQLPNLSVQYADYSAWQRRRMTGAFLERHLAYWKEQLRDLSPALELPTDGPCAYQVDERGASHHFQLTDFVVDRFRALARQEGTTLFTVMLAAFQVWLHDCTGQTDVVVSTPVANRERPEVQALLGYFLNTVPIRARLEGSLTFREVVRQVRETVLGAFDHAGLPFQKMVELAVKERRPEQRPLYQVMFVLLEEGLSPLRLDQVQGRFVPMETKASRSALILSIQANGQTLDCRIDYSVNLFTAERVARLVQHLTELFQSISEHPQQPIGRAVAIAGKSLVFRKKSTGDLLAEAGATLGDSTRRTEPQASNTGVPGETSQPLNIVELKLLRIWEQLFQREYIGRRDNFFALGGHSLMAARLSAEIEHVFGCRLPIAILFQLPTVELLATRVAGKDRTPPRTLLIPLQTLGSKPPLFCIPGAGGDAYSFLGLSKFLAPDQPFYVIQHPRLDSESAPHLTIEEMAAHYVKEMLSVQAEGPFYLVGYSMGGLVAFEMAQQLGRRGERLALLALLDTAPISHVPWVFYGLAMSSYIPSRCVLHFRRWWKLPHREQLDYLQGRWTALCHWMNWNCTEAPPLAAASLEEGLSSDAPDLFNHHCSLAFAYRLQPYTGSVEVFVSDEAISGWKWYWKHLARGGVSFHQIPGRHFDIFSPDHLPTLARSLTAVLDRVQEKRSDIRSQVEHAHASLVS